MKTAVHQYEDKLLEFAYGELPNREAEAVEAHVHGCARCSEALEQIRSVRTSMAVLPMEPAPEAGLESLLAYAEQHAARTRAAAPKAWWKRYLLPMAPVAALMVVGVVAFRANQEYQPNALKAAVEAKHGELAEQRAEEKGRAKEPAPPPPAAAPAVAQPVAQPAVAPDKPAQEELKPQEQGAVAQLEDQKLVPDYSNAAQRGALRGKADSAKQFDDAAPKPAPKPPAAQYKREAKDGAFAGGVGTGGAGDDNAYAERQSVTKRQAPMPAKKKAPAKTEVAEREAPMEPLAAKPAAVANNNVGYGLDSPGRANQPAADKAGSPETRRDLAEKSAAETKESEAGARAAAKQPAAMPPPQAAPAPVVAAEPAPSKKEAYAPPKSLSVGLSSGSSVAGPSTSARSRNDEVAQAVEENVDRKVENDRADTQRRANTKELEARLLEARKASTSGNHKLEISLCLEVLNGGAEGYQRAEALKRLCDVYEAVGAQAQADPYCDALVRDFSATAAARDVMQRRSMMQRVQAAPPTGSGAAESAEGAPSKAKASKKASKAPAKSFPAAVDSY